MPSPDDIEQPGFAGEKVFDPITARAINRSVDSPQPMQNTGFGGGASNLMYFASSFNDGIPRWGTNVQFRDIKLREFISSEAYAASAFGSIVAKYASAGWEITGPKRTRIAAHKMLHQANWGAGWENFVSKFAWDYLTQDKGAFVELIRSRNSPDAPVIAFRTLDPQNCWPTGNPDTPVIFFNKITGKYHKMRWWHVWHQLELPVNHYLYPDIQLSALSRCLAGAKVFKNIMTYVEEKTGGRHSRALHVISGVGKQDIVDALALQQNESDNQLLTRYIQPSVMTILDPQARASVATLEFSALPENFNLSENLKDYFMLLSLALSTDYGELAPLPGKSLGSGAQSEMMDKKSERKGSGLFRKNLEHFINYIVLPENVHFNFDQTDLDAELKEAEIKKTRAEARSIMILNQEVDSAGARQLALDEEDMSPELFLAMNERDLTANNTIGDESQMNPSEPTDGPGSATPRAPAAPTGNGTNKTDFPRRLQTNVPRGMTRNKPMNPMAMNEGKITDSAKIR